MLDFVPRPALALLFVFPVSETYERHRLAEDEALPTYAGKGDDEPRAVVPPNDTQRLRPDGSAARDGEWAGEGSYRCASLSLFFFSLSLSLCVCVCSRCSTRMANLGEWCTEAGSTLDSLIKKATPLEPGGERSQALGNGCFARESPPHSRFAGATEAPSAQDDVDLHYVCFVKTEDGTLWELDGRRKGPLARVKLGEDEDVLSIKALEAGPYQVPGA